MSRLARLRTAAWAGLLALALNAVFPVLLTVSFAAGLAAEEGASGASAGHAHHHHGVSDGGHTHRGHADCVICGALDHLAAFPLPVLEHIHWPDGFAAPADVRTPLCQPVLAVSSRTMKWISIVTPAWR